MISSPSLGALVCFVLALLIERSRRAAKDVPRLRVQVDHWRRTVRAAQREGFEPELRIASANYAQVCEDLRSARRWAFLRKEEQGRWTTR